MGVTIAIDREPTRTRATGWRASGRAPSVAAPSDEAAGHGARPGRTGAEADGRTRLRRDHPGHAGRADRATAGERFNLHAGGLADERRTGARARRPRRGPARPRPPGCSPNDSATSPTRPCRSPRTGVVHPHAKPLSRDHRPRATRADKAQLSPDDLGLRPTPGTGRAGAFRGAAPRRTRPPWAGPARADGGPAEPHRAVVVGLRGGRPPRHPAVPGRRHGRGLGPRVRRDQRAPRRARSACSADDIAPVDRPRPRSPPW